jgi:CRISPR-associated protein Cas5h
MVMKALIFDIWGDLAHFRKFYTTSSPLTFSFPPPPTVKGMVAAIIGLDREEYLQVLAAPKCKIAVQIVKPVKKIRMGLNYINTKENKWIPIKKGSHNPRSQIPVEFLYEPVFRIYFNIEDTDIRERLKSFLQHHKSYFTLSLGLSELLANYSYVGEAEFTPMSEERTAISSVFAASALVPGELEIPAGVKLYKEKVPVHMTPERVVERYEDVIFEGEGRPLKGLFRNCWVNKEGKMVYFF